MQNTDGSRVGDLPTCLRGHWGAGNGSVVGSYVPAQGVRDVGSGNKELRSPFHPWSKVRGHRLQECVRGPLLELQFTKLYSGYPTRLRPLGLVSLMSSGTVPSTFTGPGDGGLLRNDGVLLGRRDRTTGRGSDGWNGGSGEGGPVVDGRDRRDTTPVPRWDRLLVVEW